MDFKLKTSLKIHSQTLNCVSVNNWAFFTIKVTPVVKKVFLKGSERSSTLSWHCTTFIFVGIETHEMKRLSTFSTLLASSASFFWTSRAVVSSSDGRRIGRKVFLKAQNLPIFINFCKKSRTPGPSARTYRHLSQNHWRRSCELELESISDADQSWRLFF